MNLLSIFFCTILIVNMAKAQNFFKIKPIVDLNAKPQATPNPKLPEERRKMSVFPKNIAKFVVTSKPYSKVRTFSPWEISTKKPLMQKLIPNEVKTSKVVPVTKRPVMKFTYRPPYTFDDIEEVEAKSFEKENNNNKGTEKTFLVYPSINENSLNTNNKFTSQQNGHEDDTVSFDEKINRVSSKEASANSKVIDLDNNRQKRLSVQSYGDGNTIDVPVSGNTYLTEEEKDNNEYIFITSKTPVNNKKLSHFFGIEEDLEIATEVIWLEEATKSRPERT